MTLSIVDFLRERLAEDEAVADAASKSPWKRHYHGGFMHGIHDGSDHALIQGKGEFCCELLAAEDVNQIVRHDPARVLREVAAKRAILEDHVKTVEVVLWPDAEAIDVECCARCSGDLSDPDEGVESPCLPLRALASVYADHSEYDPEWAVA